MKLNALPVILLFAGLSAGSCIKEEAPNSEADIESCTLADKNNLLILNPVIGNKRITLFLKKGTVTALAPEFTLTPGATISPAGGTERNFTTPQEYEVTSEDGRWKKTYTVEAATSGIKIPHVLRFENVRMEGKYQIFYETNEEETKMWEWASGNPGFNLTGAGSGYADYPTYQSESGYKGKCLALTTRKTGSFGAGVNMPIAAGNLFIGTFDVLNALKDALTATRFGMPFDYIPTSLHGYYKYRSGEVFYELDKAAPDKLKPVDRKDRFNIYAVFYESTKDMETVDGTNALSPDNPNVLAVAQIAQDEAVETDEWKTFDIPFVFRPGKGKDTVDADKVYCLAIVFTSSLYGDRFEGAPGSTLCVDEVTLECKEPENEPEE